MLIISEQIEFKVSDIYCVKKLKSDLTDNISLPCNVEGFVNPLRLTVGKLS
jgi:hypothetical protein